ncbi:MAG TPA: hypothetical protein VKB30_08390 [Candidatus Limnocylindrales bacterium]|nr:hypothetical protein [Candidatus Limnocylindrales bacterium]
MPSFDRRSRAGTRRVAAIATASLMVVVLRTLALAADPTATPGGAAGDPRSSGEGPGLVGNPGWAIAIVILVGVVTLLLTVGYVRATARRTGGGDH